MGDACDLDDLTIQFVPIAKSLIRWQTDAGYQAYNLYRGSLERLRQSGEYTQNPAVEPEAAHWCGLTTGEQPDDGLPPPGRANFYLVTGDAGSVESSLGNRSDGATRPNSFPCP